jgi:hypothetical protein
MTNDVICQWSNVRLTVAPNCAEECDPAMIGSYSAGAFSEGREKPVAINTERGSRTAAICDIAKLKVALVI